MINVSIQGNGLNRFQQMLARMRRKAPQANARATNEIAAVLWQKVQANASGRPGPNIVTGAYRASIQITQPAAPAMVTEARVGTGSPYANRLEFGFVGVDSIGRHYHQSAYPHWRPALQEMAGELGRYRTTFLSEVT